MATLSFIPPGLLAALASRPAAALLPRTPPSIRLHEPQRRPDDPRRINLFPGRALGEREFERLQAYVPEVTLWMPPAGRKDLGEMLSSGATLDSMKNDTETE